MLSMLLWTAGAVQAGSGLAWGPCSGLGLSTEADMHHESSAVSDEVMLPRNCSSPI